jgi:hypothetical protein
MLKPMAHPLTSQPLKIRRADGFGLRLPMKKPVLMAGVRLEFSENWLIRLETMGWWVGVKPVRHLTMAGRPWPTCSKVGPRCNPHW